MRTLRLISLVVPLIVAAPLARASADPFTRGTLEISPSLSFNRSTYTPVGGGDALSTTHIDLSAGVGRFVSPRWELEGALLVQHRDESGVARNGFGASAAAIVNSPAKGNVIPFFSVGLGGLSYSNNGQSDRTILLPILRAGFRTMIGDTRSVNVSISFQHETNPKSPFEKSDNLFEVGVGLSMLHPKTQ